MKYPTCADILMDIEFVKLAIKLEEDYNKREALKEELKDLLTYLD